MGMSTSYGPADETESIATLHRSIELGCTFLDTAEVYGPFTNEELLGRALEGILGQPDKFPAARLREIALHRFAWESVARKTLDLYGQAVDASPRAGTI